MERRFELRLEELLEDAVLDPRIPDGMLDRLERFVEPFAACLRSSEQQQHAWEYVAGLFSDVKRKNAETIAYLHNVPRAGSRTPRNLDLDSHAEDGCGGSRCRRDQSSSWQIPDSEPGDAVRG